MKKLSKEQEKALELIAISGITEKFYLTGGTAIAIKYGHRLSEDLDFFSLSQFSEENFPDQELLNLWSKWGGLESFSKGTFQGKICEVFVSFFSYPYPLIKPLEKFQLKNFHIILASDEDLIATKAVAIIQRGQKKDFFDFYFLLKKHRWTLKDVIKFCQKKYRFSEAINKSLLKALTYFRDAENQTIMINERQSLSQEEWEKIKCAFTESVRSFCNTTF
jgi:predicted nucleotidyltransferase component of viral defense system